MTGNSLPVSVTDYLSARGMAEAARAGLGDPVLLVRAFRSAAPKAGADPLSPPCEEWISAALDCFGAMDERLYEHYRAMADLIRAHFFSVPRDALLAARAWEGVREKALRLGLLPEDRFGMPLRQPHVGQLPDHLWRKAGEPS